MANSLLLLGILVSFFSSLVLCDLSSLSASTGAFAEDKKLMIGYFSSINTFSSGSLPKGVYNSLELLDDEMTSTIKLYDVIIQSFVHPEDIINNAQIVETSKIKNGREGVNGKKGLKQICKENGVKLVIAFGGGGAKQLIPNDPKDFGKLIDAMYNYVVSNGYSGIDIDEENTLDTNLYVSFMKALSKKFHSGPTYLTVSTAVGPLFCCFASRGICALNDDLDWVFMMLYDGLQNGGGFDLNVDTVSSPYISQSNAAQAWCNISKPNTPTDVGNIAKGSCQFIDYALHLNWNPKKLIMGLPSYSYPSSLGWAEIMGNNNKKNFTISQHDDQGLTTLYSNTTMKEWIPNAQDVATRIHYVLNPAESKLGVQYLTSSGSRAKIAKCEAKGLHAGATLLGIGFWHIGLENDRNHQLSSASRSVVDSINAIIKNSHSNNNNNNSPTSNKTDSNSASPQDQIQSQVNTSATTGSTIKTLNSTISQSTTGNNLPSVPATTSSENTTSVVVVQSNDHEDLLEESADNGTVQLSLNFVLIFFGLISILFL